MNIKFLIVTLKFIGLSLSLLLMVIISRFFGKDTYGIFSYYFSLMQILATLMLFGLDIKLFKEQIILKTENELSKVYFFLVVRLLLFFLLILTSRSWILLFSSMSAFFLSLRTINSVVLRLNSNYILYALGEFLVLNFLFLIAILFLLCFGLKLNHDYLRYMVLGSHLISMYFSFIYTLVFVRIDLLKFRIKVTWLYEVFYAFFKDLKILIPSLLWMLFENIDILLIRFLFNYGSLGIYSILLKFSYIVYVPVLVLNTAYLSNPSLKTITSIRKWSFLFAAILTLFLIIFSKYILYLFQIPFSDCKIFYLLLMSFLLSAFFGISYNMAQLKLDDLKVSKMLLLSLLIDIIISILLSVHLGLIAIAVGKFISINLFSFYLYRSIYANVKEN